MLHHMNVSTVSLSTQSTHFADFAHLLRSSFLKVFFGFCSLNCGHLPWDLPPEQIFKSQYSTVTNSLCVVLCVSGTYSLVMPFSRCCERHLHSEMSPATLSQVIDSHPPPRDCQMVHGAPFSSWNSSLMCHGTLSHVHLIYYVSPYYTISSTRNLHWSFLNPWGPTHQAPHQVFH